MWVSEVYILSDHFVFFGSLDGDVFLGDVFLGELFLGEDLSVVDFLGEVLRGEDLRGDLLGDFSGSFSSTADCCACTWS